MSIYPDAKILPGPEEHHALHVTHRKELACQALHLSGWSSHSAAKNLPSLEGWSQITLPLFIPFNYLILVISRFMVIDFKYQHQAFNCIIQNLYIRATGCNNELTKGQMKNT